MVFDVDAFCNVVGGEADDFVFWKLAAVGGEDLRVGFGDVDGGFGFGFRLLCFFGKRLVFNGFGHVGEIGVDVFYSAAETGNADFEAVNLTAHAFDG